jgi:hypothetical protein
MFVWPLIAVAGILAAVWFFGVRRPGPIGDAEAVRRLVLSVDPEFRPGEVALDPDGSRALVTDASGSQLLLLFTMGNQVALRRLDATGVRRIESTDAAGSRRVVVRLFDLGCPKIELTLASADAATWTERLERLAGPVPPAGSGASQAGIIVPG